MTRGDLYALAGALSVTVSGLLQQLHQAAGGPVTDVEALSEDRRSVVVAAEYARGAAAACSALVARLLIIERDAARRGLPELGRPASVEPGVTSVELGPYLWQASQRVAQSARTEVGAAVQRWQDREDEAAKAITLTLERLLEYVDVLVETFTQRSGMPSS